MDKISVKCLEKNDIRDIGGYQNIGHDRWRDACQAFYHENYFVAVYLAGY